MTEAAAPQFKLDDIVKKYVELRDQIEQISKEAQAKTEPLATAMRNIETYLMKVLNDSGQTKIGTEFGTAFISLKTGCNIADRDTFWNFIQAEPEARRQLLTLTANKTNVSEFTEKNQGVLPPGLNWTAMKTVQIRRA